MFVLGVADNFHAMDEEASYTHSEHPTWAEALAAARRLVDESLAEHFRPGMTAEELYDRYTTFGDDPYVVAPPPGERFSAWEYAKLRCGQLCEAGGPADPEPGAATDVSGV